LTNHRFVNILAFQSAIQVFNVQCRINVVRGL